MALKGNMHHRLHRIFNDAFGVGDIAEPLASFDGTSRTADVFAAMDRHGYEIVGVRHDGRVAGYLRRDGANQGDCRDAMIVFREEDVISDTASLPALVGRLAERRRLFVTSFGEVGGIVSRTDLQKPPVRMWLFGVVTIIEMGLTRAIEMVYSDDSWQQLVSPSRLEKAEALRKERQRRKQDPSLLDCLQLGDKAQITLRDDRLYEEIGYRSRNRGKETIKQIEALRNNLAHSQDIVACDWETIVGISENLDELLGRLGEGPRLKPDSA